MPYTVLLQDQTMLFAPAQLGVGSVCGLGLDLVGIHSVSLAARRTHSAKALRKSRQLESLNVS